MRRIALLLLVAALVGVRPASAGPMLDISSGIQLTLPDGFSAGYQFTLSASSVVNALGLWDEGRDGLAASPAVALWTAGGSLLTSTTVSNGSTPVASGSPDGRWLFQAVNPLTIGPGDYVVAAFYANEDVMRITNTIVDSSHPIGLTLATGVTFDFGRVGQSASLAFPTATVLSPSMTVRYFGPNVDLQAVPEPVTLAFVGTGLACLTARMKRSTTRRD
jgi:hypothetical protein